MKTLFEIDKSLDFTVQNIILDGKIELNLERLRKFLEPLRKIKKVDPKEFESREVKKYEQLYREMNLAFHSLSDNEKQCISADEKSEYLQYDKTFGAIFKDLSDSDAIIDQYCITFESDLELLSLDLSDFNFPDDVLNFSIKNIDIKGTLDKACTLPNVLKIEKRLAEFEELLEKNLFLKGSIAEQKYNETLERFKQVKKFYEQDYTGLGVRKDKNIVYIGSYKNGLREGKGLAIYISNLTYYYGYWHNDMYNGEGITQKGAFEYLNDKVDNIGKLTKYYKIITTNEKEIDYNKSLEILDKLRSLSGYRNADELYLKFKALSDKLKIEYDKKAERERIARQKENIRREKEQKEKRKNVIINSIYFTIITLVLAATAIPQLLLLNKWYMLLFVPVICSVHSAFMTTTFFYFGRGSRIWKFVFMGLLTFEIIGAIFVCDMPRNVGTAFYVVLSFILMVIFEHLSEFLAEVDNFYNIDPSYNDKLSINMKKWNWKAFGRKMGVALWVAILATFFGFVGYIAELSFSYSMWHLLWTLPCMMIVVALITGFVDRIGFGFADEGIGAAPSIAVAGTMLLVSFIYSTVIVCQHTFSFGIFCFLLLMFVVHTVAATIAMFGNMLCCGIETYDLIDSLRDPF